MIEIAQWDTEHFGIKVGSLIPDGNVSKETLDKEITSAKAEGYDLLYLKGCKLQEDCLSDRVILADEKVVYSLTKHTDDYHKCDKVVSYLNKELDVKLLTLALQSGGHSRYYTDKNMPVSVYITLYRIWIKNSLNGSIATDVLVYLDGNEVLGLLTYKLNDKKAVIGLVDVDNSSKGKGIGSKLMHTFLSVLPYGTKVEVATQKSNSVACHYYEKNGFNIDCITNIYHIWIK